MTKTNYDNRAAGNAGQEANPDGDDQHSDMDLDLLVESESDSDGEGDGAAGGDNQGRRSLVSCHLTTL